MPRYNFTRASSLYLPEMRPLAWLSLSGPRDMLASTAAPFGILGEVMRSAFAPPTGGAPSYKGVDNMVLRQKWSTLLQTAGG